MSDGGPDALYVDTSALVKLFRPEPESRALQSFLDGFARLASSALTLTEALRAVGRAGDPGGALVAEARSVLQQVHLWDMSQEILEHAGTLPPAPLRTLDAIHVATALSIQPRLTGVVTYDHRLAHAARYHGIAVYSPGR